MEAVRISGAEPDAHRGHDPVGPDQEPPRELIITSPLVGVTGSSWTVATVSPAARYGLVLTALALVLLLVIQLADLRVFALSVTTRKVLRRCAVALWAVLVLLVIVRFVVID